MLGFIFPSLVYKTAKGKNDEWFNDIDKFSENSCQIILDNLIKIRSGTKNQWLRTNDI